MPNQFSCVPNAPTCKGRLVGPPKGSKCLIRTLHESGYCKKHRNQAPPPRPRYQCDSCDHHMDSHLRNKEECLRGECECVAYTKNQGEN